MKLTLLNGRIVHVCLILFFLFGSLSSIFALSEAEKIQALLDIIVKSNLIFIRNSVEYSAVRTRKHLELKLSYAGSRISTAEQFIKYIATKSSWTGKPYYVKLPDGKKIKTADWLHQKLKEIEKKNK